MLNWLITYVVVAITTEMGTYSVTKILANWEEWFVRLYFIPTTN